MFRFDSLTVEIYLLQAPLSDTQIFFGASQIEFQLYKVDLRFTALLGQLFHARDQVAAGGRVILAEFYFAFGLLDFGLLDLELRDVSSFISDEAFFLSV